MFTSVSNVRLPVFRMIMSNREGLTADLELIREAGPGTSSRRGGSSGPQQMSLDNGGAGERLRAGRQGAARRSQPTAIVRGMVDLPWDCVVLGIPKSVQAKATSIQRWKAAVRAAAQAAWPSVWPLDQEMQIHVTYFHDGAPLDVDNMLKPIQDALCGVVYKDDKQLTDTHGHLRDLNAQYRVRGLTPAQAHGFMSNGPFVHIRIELPSPLGELP